MSTGYLSSWPHPTTGITGGTPTKMFNYASIVLSSTSVKSKTLQGI